MSEMPFLLIRERAANQKLSPRRSWNAFEANYLSSLGFFYFSLRIFSGIVGLMFA